MDLQFIWTNGNDETFKHFYLVTEQYYNRLVGGEEKRRQFIPYYASSAVDVVLLVFYGNGAVGCSGLKKYSDTDAEIKRVWVEPEYRRHHIAAQMMTALEGNAKTMGYKRTILQTREIQSDAVKLYTGRGYHQIDNYPPYDRLDGAICFAKEL